MKTWLALARREAEHALVEAVRKEDQKVTCRGKGCSGCCQGMVVAVQDEVDAIVETGLDDSARARIAAYTVEDPCPLLDPVTNACGAYANRPLTCRAFVSYSPPAWCSDNRRCLRAKRPRLGPLVQNLYEGHGEIGVLGEMLKKSLAAF